MIAIPTASALVHPQVLDLAAPAAFTKDWPQWARILMDVPLRIVVILVAAVVVAAVARTVVQHTSAKMARTPGRVLSLAGGADAARSADRREARFKTLGSVLKSAITVVVWILAAGLVLEALGVNPGLIITSIGVVGVGVGLGAQSLVKDMVAGVFMLVEDQYGIGDVIDSGPATGTVVAMTLRVTTLRDADGVIWYIPNGTVTRIGNKSQEELEATS